MPLKCSASGPVWTSSPMKERAHISSFSSLKGQYENITECENHASSGL